MKGWIEFLRNMPCRPRDGLLAVPLIGIVGLTTSTLEGQSDGWSILWVGLSGASIAVYLIVEWLGPRR